VPDKPAAEVRIDEALVRRLVAAQASHLLPHPSGVTVRKVAEGWDSEVWRIGADLAARLPRRSLAAPLVLHEQVSLPLIGPRLEATGIRVPTPLVHGVPDEEYPWAWSVVPWIDGARGIDTPRAQRSPWAAPLAAALGALHQDAPADHPVNPVRGRPLSTRAAAFEERVAGLASRGTLTAADAAALESVWSTGLAAAPWDAPPVWVHGDLHPGNLVAENGELAGIIDFGDVTGGDPAYDLAGAWLTFDTAGRARFIAATGDRYDADTWVRAHAWAAAIAVVLLAHSDDNPDYAALGVEARIEVTATA
jgi:aminoglycoside phosphotransferase (APT) family kinase protein